MSLSDTDILNLAEDCGLMVEIEDLETWPGMFAVDKAGLQKFARRILAEAGKNAEPVAEADNGILNWIDGRQFNEHRLLYAAPQRTAAVALPDIEITAAKVHEAWMELRQSQGVKSRKLDDGEEMMVPYEQLSDRAQEFDRQTVRTVYKAIADAAANEQQP